MVLGGLTGCGGDDDPGEAPPAETAATAPPTATSPGVRTFDVPPRTPLDAGRYRTTEFAVPLELTLDGGWTSGGGELPEFLDVYSSTSDTAGLWFLTLPTAFDPSDPDAEATVRPADLVDFLHEHPALGAGPKQTTTVGGREAVAFDFAVDEEDALDIPRCPEPCVPLTRLSDGGETGFFAGETGRIHVVEGPPRPMAIIYSSSGAATAEHDASSEAVIDSVSFTD